MTKAAYKEAVALVERSGLQPTKLVSQKDLDKLRDDQKIESANDSLSNVIDSVITREEFQLDRKKVKNDFYLTPEELEKKALLKFKENHENEKRSIRNPMEAQMLQEAEEEFRATGGHNAQEPGKGDRRYQQMLDMGMVDPGQSYEDWARINNPGGMVSRHETGAAAAKLQQIGRIIWGPLPYYRTFDEVILRKNVLML